MRREIEFALFAILPTALAPAQQTAPPTASPAAQTVYYASPSVTAPELLPAALTDLPSGHCQKLNGKAVLTAIVDTHGVTRNVYFLRPLGNDLDRIALNLVMAEQFKPGTHDGAPAATSVAIELNMNACIEEEKDGTGQKVYLVKLRSIPNEKLDLEQAPPEGATLTLISVSPSRPGERDTAPYKVGAGISKPVLIKSVDAMYSDKARKERISGPCLIGLIVDANGLPQNVHVIRGLEPSLDQHALYAVSHYRFKPAMRKGGTPVPVVITVEVDFHLY